MIKDKKSEIQVMLGCSETDKSQISACIQASALGGIWNELVLYSQFAIYNSRLITQSLSLTYKLARCQYGKY